MGDFMGELMSRDTWRKVTAEFAAMFLFVFICVGCVLGSTGAAEGAWEQGHTAPLTISLCFGLTIFVLAHCFGHVSGAHVNPAVTLSLVLGGHVTPLTGVLYMGAHFLASIVAAGLLMITMGLDSDTMGGYNKLTGPEDNKVLRGFMVEMIMTFVLCLTVYATIDPKRDASALGPLAIGVAVALAHFTNVPLTGCGINPGRSLGPALLTADQAAREDLWVFILAPFVGGSIAAVLYPLWFAEENFNKGPTGKSSLAAHALKDNE